MTYFMDIILVLIHVHANYGVPLLVDDGMISTSLFTTFFAFQLSKK